MFKYGLFLCCLVSLILICACGKREMTEKDENQILEIIRLANHDNGRNNHSRNLLYGDKILTLANPLKDDDKTLYSKTFAYNIKGYHYYLRGDKFSANSYYMEAMKHAERIRDKWFFRIPAKSDTYLYFFKLNSNHKKMAEYWLKQWGDFFQSYMDSPVYSHGSKNSNELLLMRYGVYVDIKVNYLVNSGKIDEALKLLESCYGEVKKFYSDPDEFLWAFSLSDTAAKVFTSKNDLKKMIFYAEKSLKLADKNNIFPENSFFIMIRYYKKKGDFQSAEKYCRQGLTLWEKCQSKSKLSWKIHLMILLAETRWHLNDKLHAKKILIQAEKLRPPPDLMNLIEKKRKEWF